MCKGVNIYFRTNSDLCHLQHKLIGFYNPNEKCLHRGTDWVFKYGGLRFVFRGLNSVSALLIMSDFEQRHIVCERLTDSKLQKWLHRTVRDRHLASIEKSIYIYIYIYMRIQPSAAK